MSAQLQGDSVAAGIPLNRFSAHLALSAGVSVSIHAPSLVDLQLVVGKLQPTEAVNDPAPKPAVKPTATPAPTAAPQAQAAGNASASTSTPAGAPPASGGSTSAGEAPRPTYDDVKARVLRIAKEKGRDAAAKVLAEFKVDNANKLTLEQYPAFIEAADKLLGAS